jgi:hypothetical protein
LKEHQHVLLLTRALEFANAAHDAALSCLLPVAAFWDAPVLHATRKRCTRIRSLPTVTGVEMAMAPALLHLHRAAGELCAMYDN